MYRTLMLFEGFARVVQLVDSEDFYLVSIHVDSIENLSLLLVPARDFSIQERYHASTHNIQVAFRSLDHAHLISVR